MPVPSLAAAPEDDGRQRRVGSSHHQGLAAADPSRRQPGQAQDRAAHAPTTPRRSATRCSPTRRRRRSKRTTSSTCRSAFRGSRASAPTSSCSRAPSAARSDSSRSRFAASTSSACRRSSQELTKKPRGLILVTGPTGSGKSTTLAAMIDKINNDDHGHIITIEDPVEFLHEHKNCIVNQREVGADTQSFKKALKSILRQDPDVVLVGELRDLETIEAALTIAETGHVCFGTLHTNGCVSTINRVIDAFPAYQQPQIRAQLSMVLEGVLSQSLVPKPVGRTRAGARGHDPDAGDSQPHPRGQDRTRSIRRCSSARPSTACRRPISVCYSLVSKKQITMEQAIEYSSDPEELKNMIAVGRPDGAAGSTAGGEVNSANVRMGRYEPAPARSAKARWRPRRSRRSPTGCARRASRCPRPRRRPRTSRSSCPSAGARAFPRRTSSSSRGSSRR